MKMSKEDIEYWCNEPYWFEDGSKSTYEHNVKCYKARKIAGVVETKGSSIGEVITVIAIILLFILGICPAIV